MAGSSIMIQRRIRKKKRAGPNHWHDESFLISADEERNDINTSDIPKPLSRELLSFPLNPLIECCGSKHHSLKFILATILIFFASIKVGIFVGYQLFESMYIKTTGRLSSKSVMHLAVKEKKTLGYVTSFWAETSNSTTHPAHRKEIQAALLANINNPQFDQVVVLLDGISENANCTHFYDEMRRLMRSKIGLLGPIQKLSCVNICGGQPTYFEMFNYTLSEAVLGDIVVLSNADQAFDDTVSKARYLSPSVLAVLGTRGFSNSTVPKNLQQYYDSVLAGTMKRNMSEEEVDRCMYTSLSWDTFIFHRKMIQGQLKEEDFLRMNKANEAVPFYMNEYGAETAALWGLQHHSKFTSMYNACEEINSWAFHLTKKMTKLHTKEWKTEVMNNGFYVVPEPYAFASKDPKCVYAENCFVQSS